MAEMRPRRFLDMAYSLMPKAARSWFGKEPDEQYEWVKRAGESEAGYQNRLRHMGEEEEQVVVGPWRCRRPGCTDYRETASKAYVRGHMREHDRNDARKKRKEDAQYEPVVKISGERSMRSDALKMRPSIASQRAADKAKEPIEEDDAGKQPETCWKCNWPGCDSPVLYGSQEHAIRHMQRHYESRAEEQPRLGATDANKRQERGQSSQMEKNRRKDRGQPSQMEKNRHKDMAPKEEAARPQHKTKRKGAEAVKPIVPIVSGLSEKPRWVKQPQESAAEYLERLGLIFTEHDRVLTKEDRRKAEAANAKDHVTDAGKPEESVTEAGNADDLVTDAGKTEESVTEAGNAEDPVTDAGKPEESVTEAGNAEDPVTVGSQWAMYQEMFSPNCTQDEEILQQVLEYKLDGVDDSYMWEGAEEKERRAMVKAIQERMARTRKALFLHLQENLPTKDKESRKAQASVTGAEKPEEAAINQEVLVNDDKETLEQVLQEKLDLQEVSTRPAADPSSMLTIQDDRVDGGKSALAKQTAEREARLFAGYRKRWERDCCKECDHFEHITVLSSMQYTHYTPGMIPFNIAETLQIFSIRLKLRDDNAGCFEFPLSVYGVVAVRDNLDSRRNIIFSCDRTRAQELTQDDPFLHLTGPSRAILSADRVYFEIKLLVKGAAASQDKLLFADARIYAEKISTLCYENLFCTLEVCLQTVRESVQATIVSVQMLHKEELRPLNFKFGGQVACTTLLPRRTRTESEKIVLVESKGGKMPQGDSGYVHLWRQVVSVERGGGLDVVIQGYKKSGAVLGEGRAHFSAQSCNISQQQCIVGLAQVTVTVAWSIVPRDMEDVLFGDA